MSATLAPELQEKLEELEKELEVCLLLFCSGPRCGAPSRRSDIWLERDTQDSAGPNAIPTSSAAPICQPCRSLNALPLALVLHPFVTV